MSVMMLVVIACNLPNTGCLSLPYSGHLSACMPVDRAAYTYCTIILSYRVQGTHDVYLELCTCKSIIEAAIAI